MSIYDLIKMNAVTDYTMARRAVIAGFRSGSVSKADICDAQPDLLVAAKNAGECSDSDCPVCGSSETSIVTFAFGDGLGRNNGRMIPQRSISEYTSISGVRCFSVEVCPGCSWNHILRAYIDRESSAPTAGQVAESERPAPGLRLFARSDPSALD